MAQRILLIDDDVALGGMVADYLAQAGFRVTSSETAVQTSSSTPPDFFESKKFLNVRDSFLLTVLILSCAPSARPATTLTRHEAVKSPALLY